MYIVGDFQRVCGGGGIEKFPLDMEFLNGLQGGLGTSGDHRNDPLRQNRIILFSRGLCTVFNIQMGNHSHRYYNSTHACTDYLQFVTKHILLWDKTQ